MNLGNGDFNSMVQKVPIKKLDIRSITALKLKERQVQTTFNSRSRQVSPNNAIEPCIINSEPVCLTERVNG
jgi:hypothetical protein